MPTPPVDSRESGILDRARSLFYQHALVKLDQRHIGAVAAINPKDIKDKAAGAFHEDLNYGEVFIRDNVPVMIFLLLEKEFQIVRDFLNVCWSLQSNQFQTMGIFPASFTEKAGALVADYGQRAIGRVVSVDATLWVPIIAHAYVQASGDVAWARQPVIQFGIQRFLDLILHPRFRDAPTIHVPDGAFMIDRPLDVWGSPLEIQVLLYGSLCSAAGLIKQDLCHGKQGHFMGAFRDKQKQQFMFAVAWAKRLRRYLLKHYWVNTKTVQVLRQRPTEEYGEGAANEYNIQTESIPHWLQEWLGEEGGYLLGNIRTGRPDFRFFTLGNCLGAIFDVISPRQQQALFHLIWHNQAHLVAQMPLRICHPPLEGSDWQSRTGYDRKNRPWCYHNSGHWPCLTWFLAAAMLRHQQLYPSLSQDTWENCQSLLYSSYKTLLKRLPQQRWAEYFDGPTGLWTGQQARYYQTWTIVGLLLLQHLLKVEQSAAHILNIPRLSELSQPF